jgi:hypothetical protein
MKGRQYQDEIRNGKWIRKVDTRLSQRLEAVYHSTDHKKEENMIKTNNDLQQNTTHETRDWSPRSSELMAGKQFLLH